MVHLSVKHRHLNPLVAETQVAYQKSDASLISARGIVSVKLQNCERLLALYARSRRRAMDDSAVELWRLQTRLVGWRLGLVVVKDRRGVLLVEARAARAHWRAVALICHYPDWRRFYPHAEDSLNILLNTGYTLLARKCLAAIEAAGLLAEFGILHGRNAGDPLVYDLMEIFRQPAVDAVILSSFSRRSKSGVEIDGRTFKIILSTLNKIYQSRFRYHGRCEKLERIIFLEALALRGAMLRNRSWYPHQHRWGHRRPCK